MARQLYIEKKKNFTILTSIIRSRKTSNVEKRETTYASRKELETRKYLRTSN
jgi:hypothetical protein